MEASHILVIAEGVHAGSARVLILVAGGVMRGLLTSSSRKGYGYRMGLAVVADEGVVRGLVIVVEVGSTQIVLVLVLDSDVTHGLPALSLSPLPEHTLLVSYRHHCCIAQHDADEAGLCVHFISLVSSLSLHGQT